MKTLILTPNKTEMCGMYQLAKDLAKEFDGEIRTREDITKRGIKDKLWVSFPPNSYGQVITLLYPMHSIGKKLQKLGVKWICYDQKIPPITKTYFPNFWRRQVMRYINWRNNVTMQGADEYWDVTKREQKPRWNEQIDEEIIHFPQGTYNRWLAQYQLTDNDWKYAFYDGRKTDYKNFYRLWQVMDELKIPFVIAPENCDDETIHKYYSHCKMYVTMSLWEGYGRGVPQAEILGKPAVAYDVGAHKRHINKGICVPLDINNMIKSEILFKKAVLKVWNND